MSNSTQAGPEHPHDHPESYQVPLHDSTLWPAGTLDAKIQTDQCGSSMALKNRRQACHLLLSWATSFQALYPRGNPFYIYPWIHYGTALDCLCSQKSTPLQDFPSLHGSWNKHRILAQHACPREADKKFPDQECPPVPLLPDHIQYNPHVCLWKDLRWTHKLAEILSQQSFPSDQQEFLYLQSAPWLI